MGIALLTPAFLQDAEDDNIKALIYMSYVRGVAEDSNVVVMCIVEKFNCVMGVMAIHNKDSYLAPCFCSGRLVEVFNSCMPNLTIGPSLLRVPHSVEIR